MCDTWVALGDMTTTQSVIFAKNSDRPILTANRSCSLHELLGPRTPRCSWSMSDCHRPLSPLRRLARAHIGVGDMKKVSMNIGWRLATRPFIPRPSATQLERTKLGIRLRLGCWGWILCGLPLSAAAVPQKRLTCLAAWSSAMASSARAFPPRITRQADMIMLFWSPIRTRPGCLKHSASNGRPVATYRAARRSPTRSVSERLGCPEPSARGVCRAQHLVASDTSPL